MMNARGVGRGVGFAGWQAPTGGGGLPAPTADLSAFVCSMTMALLADKSAVGTVNRPLHLLYARGPTPISYTPREGWGLQKKRAMSCFIPTKILEKGEVWHYWSQTWHHTRW